MSLTIFHDDNSVFGDKSLSLKEFTRDTVSISLSSTEDYLYLGLYKPFQKTWVELDVANSVSNTFAIEFYNGTAWTAVENDIDETLGWTRSGFISWDLDQTDWVANTINSKELFWIRLRPSADHAGSVLRGINMVFSDDENLKEEYRGIMDFKLEADNSFIVTHNNAKKEIIQNLRNRGRIKRNSSILKDIDAFDILEPEQVREASKFLVLSKIFFEISDSVDDKYYQLYQDYKKKYDAAFDLFYLTIDIDDDGVVDSNEKLAVTRISVNRA